MHRFVLLVLYVTGMTMFICKTAYTHILSQDYIPNTITVALNVCVQVTLQACRYVTIVRISAPFTRRHTNIHTHSRVRAHAHIHTYTCVNKHACIHMHARTEHPIYCDMNLTQATSSLPEIEAWDVLQAGSLPDP